MKRFQTIQWKKLSLTLTVASLAAAGFAPALPAPFNSAPSVYAEQVKSNSQHLQQAFESAAKEFGVPVNILMSVSYNLTRWEHHNGEPSTSGGFGVMHLTDIPMPKQQPEEQNATADQISTSDSLDDPSHHTLAAASQLLKVNPIFLKKDPVENIRGGAALLAKYVKDIAGKLPVTESDWYGAVAKYSGSQELYYAQDFADQVFHTIQQGIARQTPEGQALRLTSKEVKPNPATLQSLQLHSTISSSADCPSLLPCRSIPAAYQQNGDDPSDYSNYDLADRPKFGPDIRFIVIHDTEETYRDTIGIFANPKKSVAAHYVVRSFDGDVTQMVNNKDVPWHAGNYYFNMHSIGIEHEGYAMEGATWYSERLYRSSAALVKYLGEKYDIPLDRAHIIGHNEIPGLTPKRTPAMHQDPGPFWDWEHYMELVGAPLGATHSLKDIVTIKPNFKSNLPEVQDAPLQPTNFVYLYKEPQFDADLIDDPALAIQNKKDGLSIGAKATTGQTFSLAGELGNWTAIWYGGQKAWFYNPAGSNAVAGSGELITPKAGTTSIPVYGAAYPEAAAYPADVKPNELVPLQYTIAQGQSYVAIEKVNGDYYEAPVFTKDPYATNKHIKGKEAFFRIFFNHRFAFVKASDVEKMR